eukprot:jgi/Mesvir1/909/Mv17471-RA.1
MRVSRGADYGTRVDTAQRRGAPPSNEMEDRQATYAQQSLFSFVSWPFSLKLLWAPIVDTLHFRRFGLRKSWLVPVQLVVGAMLLLSADSVDKMLGSPGTTPDVVGLTYLFSALYVLMATQDIAVDGWGLTMLSRRNVGYSSTCNVIGQALGYTVSFIIFIALNSPEFCNAYLRPSTDASDVGMVSLGSFMKFWGWVFLLATVMVAALKAERRPRFARGAGLEKWSQAGVGAGAKEGAAASIMDDEEGGDNGDGVKDVGGWVGGGGGGGGIGLGMYGSEREAPGHHHFLSVRGAYREMLNVTSLPSVRALTLFLLTSRIGFGAADGVTVLKLQEKGLPKEHLAIMAVMATPVALIVPALVAGYTAGPRPLNPFYACIPYRLALGVAYAVLMAMVPVSVGAGGSNGLAGSGQGEDHVPYLLYAAWLLCFVLSQVVTNLMHVSLMAFFAAISDPSIGGTYMTLLNTICNLGCKWPTTAALALVDVATQATGGSVDGYYLLTLVCTLLGVVWMLAFRGEVNHLQVEVVDTFDLRLQVCDRCKGSALWLEEVSYLISVCTPIAYVVVRSVAERQARLIVALLNGAY